MLRNHVRLRETQDVKQKAMAVRTLWDLAAIFYPAKRYLPYEKKGCSLVFKLSWSSQSNFTGESK
jgi:hypothetical protein